MAELITMPKLGFDMAEGKLGEWLKKAGDTVTQGETILLVETDKASVEVPAFRSGVLLKILVAGRRERADRHAHRGDRRGGRDGGG